ncbi:YqhG family protein [Bacillus sp. Marseille-P3661]|uniref:YqhG family protein n=1 Tax=Bacillus sp. Marseille-P3661 TaxID=1936234 RepID=UPI000C866AB8|nr:YqhG family protein [Bacillus sp. Marseille-P3661]
MQQQDIHNFLYRYFVSNGCDIIEQSEGHLIAQLTVDLDKQLMNRPFYWHYVEKTGGQPQPMKLTLITDQNKAPNTVQGMNIHFGSPQLHQIFESTKRMAATIRMYELIKPNGQNVALHPWLVLNTKISYQCDRKRDLFISLGLNLINGVILDRFHNKLLKKKLTPKIPDFCFTLSPLIKPKSGLLRIENVIKQMIESDDHTWADEARIRWKKDQDLLDHFYEDNDEKPENYVIEKQAIEDQYKPKIKVNIINGGLFYLSQESF